MLLLYERSADHKRSELLSFARHARHARVARVAAEQLRQQHRCHKPQILLQRQTGGGDGPGRGSEFVEID